MNTLTVSQKGRLCGEIRIHVKVSSDETEIHEGMRQQAERLLLADPQHQRSYYDLLLVDASGAELDFETNIL